MPFLKIQTNVPMQAEQKLTLVSKASQAVAEMLGKPERYVMVSVEENPAMSFAGDTEPLAYVELKSIGLPVDQTTEFSARLATLLNEHLDLPTDRIYVEFADAPRTMWGWNGGTF